MNPNFPIYIVSKGRWDSRLTAKSLADLGVPYYTVIEEQEFSKYAQFEDPKTLLILPPRYLEEYDTCDDLGDSKSRGPGAARNFAWDHAIEQGHAWHWVMDDNIQGFFRFNRNNRRKVTDGTILRCSEDFVIRYDNIAVAGLNYRFFVPSESFRPPYKLNTRIYSCLLIRNDIPYRWRGRYNEDTDLSLRVLKDGWCTLQFNAFLCGKAATQTVKGGNTKEFYAHEGTLPKSEMLVALHPDVSRLAMKYGRWHHYVDYDVFNHLRLKRKQGIEIPQGVNNYGME